MINSQAMQIWISSVLILFWVTMPLPVSSEVDQVSLPQNESEHLDFASGLFERGLYEMSLKEYESFLDTFPMSISSSEAMLGLAENYFYLKDYERASKEFLLFLEKNPSHEKYHFVRLRLGQTYFLTEKFTPALNELEDLMYVELETPFDAVRDYFLAKTYKSLGQMDQARKMFKKTALEYETHQYSPHSYVELADLNAQDGQWEEAIELYAIAYRYAQEDGLKALILFKKGETQYAGGLYDQAIATFKQLNVNFPDQPLSKDALANTLMAMFQLGHYDEVISLYQKSIEDFSNGRFMNVHLLVCDAYVQLGQLEKAIDHAKLVAGFSFLSNDEKNKAVIKQADILRQASHYDEAVALLQTLSQDQIANVSSYHYILAESYYAIGSYDQSKMYYQKLIEDEIHSSLAYEALIGLAHSHRALGNVPESRNAFLKFFHEAPTEMNAAREDALYNAFVLAVNNKDVEHQILFADLFVQAFPNSMRLENMMIHKARTYYHHGQFHKAIDSLESFLVQFPDSTFREEAKFLFAYAFQQTGQTEQALIQYEKILPSDEVDGYYYASLKNSAFLKLNHNEEKESVRLFTKILTEFPDHDLQSNHLFWILERLLSYEEYKEALNVVRTFDVSQLTEEEQLQWNFLKAETYRFLNQCEESTELYGEIISSSTQVNFLPAAYLGQSKCFIKTRQNEQARELLIKLIETYPEDNTVTMNARIQLGDLAYLNEQWESAANYYLLVGVLYDSPDSVPEALLKAGMALEKLGKRQDAKKAYQDIILTYPKSESANLAAENIRGLHE